MKKALVLLPLLLAAGVRSAEAGDVGGHVGIATSLVGFTGSSAGVFRTSQVGDEHTHLAFPIGVTLKKSARVAVDLEMVVHSTAMLGETTHLTIDPGILYRWAGMVTTGVRLAVDIGGPQNYGVIALINKAWMVRPGWAWFIEGALPINWNADAHTTSINAVAHVGIGF